MERFKSLNHRTYHPDRFHQSGSGIVDTLRKVGKTLDNVAFGKVGTFARNLIPASDENAANQFPGERHQILRLPNKKYGVANFSGPGTAVLKRLKRGDKPRTEVDKAALAHDLRYTLADDDNEMRVADEKMIKKLQELQDKKLDSDFNTKPAKYIMKGKVFWENIGVFDKDTFVNTDTKLSDEDRKLVQSKLDQLEQEGFGYTNRFPGQEIKRHLLKQYGKGHCGRGVSLPGQSGGQARKLHRFYTKLHNELRGMGLRLAGQKGSGMMQKQIENAMKDVKNLKPKARHAAKVITKHLGLPTAITQHLVPSIHSLLKGEQQVGAGRLKRLAKKIMKHVGPFLKQYGPTIASTALALL